HTTAPIKKNIGNLTKILGILALIVSASVFVVGTLRGVSPANTFLFAVASAISSIPEGLPIVVTVTLAIAIGKMAKRNAIIRKLPAVETLGTVSAIVSDKTGTLTTNQMTVREIFTESHSITISGSGFKPTGKFIDTYGGDEIKPLDFPELKRLLEVMALCNDAQLRDHVDESGEFWQVHGDPTEGALVVAAMKGNLEKQDYEISHPRVDEIGFDSAHKYMVTFHGIERNAGVLACMKGAPEKVLSMCSATQAGADTRPLTKEKIAEIEEQASNMAKQAYRVLAFAFLETKEMNHDQLKAVIPTGKKLVFLGLAGIIDPPRPEAKQAIVFCKNAGIRIFMATGDHKLTALAIGEELGLSAMDHSKHGIEGVELDDMNDEDLERALQSVGVFARVTPEHKHRIVKALQKMGYIVAVTGDGINDAPAIKASNVGVAMGIAGTDVTKEAADMVLVDDNFASIVNAVEEGRIVYENIKKVVKFLISTNIAEDFIIILAFLLFPLLLEIQDPNEILIFTAIQILWVNLVTDGVLDITLAMEPKEMDVMRNKPRDPDAKIIDREILKNTIYVSICMGIGVLTVYVVYHGMNGEVAIMKAKTMAFVLLSMFQVFNALNCRSRTHSVFKLGFFTNRWLIGSITFSVILQFLTTVLPPLQAMLSTVPLTPLDWVVILLVSSTVWIIEEIRKLVQKRK
ncbi:HAD-IC family P-type ATPase, partial [Candidatus Bathyarchaeota archaeon]|nr:HAD-IC family P-type ATPase [Candidatus Bathyarchaeota archaeon]